FLWGNKPNSRITRGTALPHSIIINHVEADLPLMLLGANTHVFLTWRGFTTHRRLRETLQGNESGVAPCAHECRGAVRRDSYLDNIARPTSCQPKSRSIHSLPSVPMVR